MLFGGGADVKLPPLGSKINLTPTSNCVTNVKPSLTASFAVSKCNSFGPFVFPHFESECADWTSEFRTGVSQCVCGFSSSPRLLRTAALPSQNNHGVQDAQLNQHPAQGAVCTGFPLKPGCRGSTDGYPLDGFPVQLTGSLWILVPGAAQTGSLWTGSRSS